MKNTRLMLLSLAMAIFISIPVTGSAGGGATRDECVAKVGEVIKLMAETGPEVVYAKVKNPGGPFVWKDSYVFCMDTKEGIILAHPYLPPQMLGRSMKHYADANGKKFMQEFLDVANAQGAGWVDYLARRPGSTQPAPKSTYVEKVPGMDLVVGAGMFPVQE